MNRDELIEVALKAIRTHGPQSEDFSGIGLFARHHRDELPVEYWETHLGTGSPSLDQILSILEPIEPDEEEEDLEDEDETIIDFSLPGDVTQYLLCVSLNEPGEVVEIAMES